jgi:hypothetical protein
MNQRLAALWRMEQGSNAGKCKLRLVRHYYRWHLRKRDSSAFQI